MSAQAVTASAVLWNGRSEREVFEIEPRISNGFDEILLRKDGTRC